MERTEEPRFNENPEKFIIIPETPDETDFRIESGIKRLDWPSNDSMSPVIPVAADETPEQTQSILKNFLIRKRLKTNMFVRNTFI